MTDESDRFEVLLTASAERDLESIHDFICEHDGVGHADHVLTEVSRIVESLSRFPERGSYPKELLAVGIKEYRQAYFKPYRVTYRVLERRVIIYLIVDRRRDMQMVLMQRLLGV